MVRKIQFIFFAFFLLCTLNIFSQELSPVWPKPGQILPSPDFEFMWNPAENAIAYNLKVFADEELTNILLDINTSDNFYQWISPINDDHYWLVKAIYDDDNYINSNLFQFSTFSPTQYSELVLWLASDSMITLADNKVAQWGDISGNENHVTQNLSEKRPVFIENTIGGLPVLRFNGTNNELQGPIIENINNSSITIFAIASGQSQTTSAQRGIFSIKEWPEGFGFARGSSAQSLVVLNNGAFVRGSNDLHHSGFNFKILSTIKDFGNNTTTFINGSLSASSNNQNLNGPFENSNFTIGNFFSFYNGDIATILVYKQALTLEQHSEIFTAIASKYAPPVNLGLDKNISYGFCPINLDATEQFVSYTWNNGESTQSIEITETGVYSVTTTDLFGFQSFDEIHVKYPNTSLNNKDSLLCLGDSKTIFPDIINPADYSYEWSTGDDTHAITVSESGNYWVKITDNQGCFSYSDTLNLVVDPFSSQFNLGDDLELCSGSIYSYDDDNLIPQITDYGWNTGDTTKQITITESGIYELTVTNLNGCIASDQIYVEIVGTAPTVFFDSDNENCFGDSIQFLDLSTTELNNTIVEWFWDFGDGFTSTEQNPIHIFSDPGSFNVTLTAITDSGCLNTYEKQIAVIPLPEASFYAQEACMGFPVLFFDESIPSDGQEIISWQWNFGDGGASNDQNPEYTFYLPGNWTISLTVTSENGCFDTDYYDLNVENSSPTPSDFTLVYPKPEQLVFENTVEFTWNSPANSFASLIEISDNSEFINALRSNVTYNQSLTLDLPQETDLYWRVKTWNVCRDTIISDFRSLKLFNPAFLDNLTLWLAADQDIVTIENTVSQWLDLSGNAFHVEQIIENNRPIKIDSVIQDKPVIRFNGNTSELIGPIIPDINNSSISIFTLVSGSSQPNAFQRGIFSINNWDNGFALIRGSSTESLVLYNNSGIVRGSNDLLHSGFNFKILSAIKNFGISTTTYINNTISASSSNQTANGTFENAPFKIGHLFNNWDGDMAEIIVFNEAISNQEHQLILKYLSTKYSPPVNLSFDRNITYGFCPVILDAGERFESYLWNTGEITQTIEVQEPGTYSVMVTDIFGFQSSDSVEVKFPSYGLNVSDVTVCLGTEVELSWGDGRPKTEDGRSKTLNAKTSPRPPSKGELGMQKLQTSESHHPSPAPVSGLRSPVSDYTFLWSTGDTTQTITVTQTGIYTLLVMDTIGCGREFTASVSVDDFEVSATLGEPRPFCMGDTLFVQSVWDPALLSHLWDDGSTAPGLPINEPGEYSVIVTNPNGCIAEITTSLSFQGNAPQVDFSTTTPCFGESSIFTGTSSAEGSEIVNRLWYFGDPGNEGATGSGEEVNYTYSQPGIFNATLHVESAAGCSRSKTLPVQVYHLPESWFTPNNACTDVPVLFNDASADVEGGIGQWLWSFLDNDGNLMGQSTEESPEFTFTTVGTAHVELVATSVVGCSDKISRAINIKESPAIAFEFTTPCLGVPVFFTDNTTAPPWAIITSQHWDFGDGNTSSQSNPSHMYQNDGIYDVTFSVTAINGCAPSLTRQVTVHSTPEAAFSTPGLCVNTPHTFVDESTVDNSTIEQWLWDFAGQGSSTQQFPEFSFNEPGPYMVSLTATSEAGCSGSIIQPVDVYPAPESEFTFFPRWGVAPLTVSFTNLSEGASLYSWDFGDGSTGSTDINPAHTFTENGVYLAQLTAFTEQGCADIATREIKVIPLSIDIAVTDVGYRVENNFMQVYANLQNLGTLEFDTLHLEFHLSGRDPIRETWTGMLLPGKSTQYTFNAQLPWRETYTHFCVEAFIPRGPEETNKDNNRKCLSFVDEFRLLSAFPNPAEGYINIGFILPWAERVTITLSDIRGYTIATLYDATAPQGITTFRIPIEHLSNGIYLYRVTFREERKVGRFMKY